MGKGLSDPNKIRVDLVGQFSVAKMFMHRLSFDDNKQLIAFDEFASILRLLQVNMMDYMTIGSLTQSYEAWRVIKASKQGNLQGN